MAPLPSPFPAHGMMTVMSFSRREFLNRASRTIGLIPAARLAQAALPKLEITRIRLYESPLTRPMLNQSFHVVTVETSAGITGIGEGGVPDTPESNIAGR